MLDDGLILLCDVIAEGGLTRLRVSTGSYITPIGDPAGTIQYAGDIIADPEFSNFVTTAATSESPSTSIGSIELNNADGHYDYLLNTDLSDARIELSMIYRGQEYAEREPKFSGILLKAEPASLSVLRLVPDTYQALLRRPMTTDTVIDTNGSELTSPVWIGDCYLVPVVMTDANDLHYRLSDSKIEAIADVYSGGSPFSPTQWDYLPEQHGFGANITAAERITVSGSGNNAFGSQILDNAEFEDWTGGVPDWYDLIAVGDGAVEEMPGVGVRMHWGASGLTTLAGNSAGDVLPDTNAGWYLVKGRIARITDGRLVIAFRNSQTIEINEVGDFTRIVWVAAGSDRSFAFGSGSSTGTPGDLVLDYIELRKVGSGETNTLQAAIEHVACAHGPLRYDQIDATSIAGLTGFLNHKLGYHQPAGGRETIDAILRQLLASWLGWYYIDEHGMLKVGRLVDPASETPEAFITDLDIVGGITPRPDLAPLLSDRWAGNRNWSPYALSELAGIEVEDPAPFNVPYRTVVKSTDALHQRYAFARGTDPIKTMINDDPAMVQMMADVGATVYGKDRTVYEVPITVESHSISTSWQFGKIVNVTSNRYGLTGGKNLLLVGKRYRMRQRMLRLLLWG